MENFMAHFNALESQSTTDRVRLEELQRSNAMKKEVIAHMKNELAKRNELDRRRNERLENFECQRKMTMENVTANLSYAKALSAGLGTLDLESANQVTNKDGVRTKLDDLRTQMSRIGEIEEKLRSDIHDLQQPPRTIAAGLITEMRTKQAIIRKEISDRMATFDLTHLSNIIKAIVAEVQAIESQRKQKLELSKELAAKSEILSNLDADNEALASQLQKLQTQFSTLQEEKEKVIKQNEDNARRLNDMELEKEELLKTSESLACELEEIRSQATSQKKKQAEIDEKISSAKRALEEMKAEVSCKEEALRRLKEQRESREAQMAVELENMKNDFEQKFEALSRQRDTYVKASEDARAEIEKWKGYEHFLHVYEERCRRIAEAQEKLLELKEYHRYLLKKVEEKRKRIIQKSAELETVRRNVDDTKREVEKRLGDMKKSRIECVKKRKEMDKVSEGKNINTGYQLEGEPRLPKIRKIEVERDERSGLRHTTTLASKLADDFKRGITVDLGDSVVREDAGGDLFGRVENIAYRKFSQPKANDANTALAYERVRGSEITAVAETIEQTQKLFEAHDCNVGEKDGATRNEYAINEFISTQRLSPADSCNDDVEGFAFYIVKEPQSESDLSEELSDTPLPQSTLEVAVLENVVEHDPLVESGKSVKKLSDEKEQKVWGQQEIKTYHNEELCNYFITKAEDSFDTRELKLDEAPWPNLLNEKHTLGKEEFLELKDGNNISKASVHKSSCGTPRRGQKVEICNIRQQTPSLLQRQSPLHILEEKVRTHTKQPIVAGLPESCVVCISREMRRALSYQELSIMCKLMTVLEFCDETTAHCVVLADTNGVSDINADLLRAMMQLV
ncbi:unnamed protein product [Angiostrongylus costaricensis]|uniref:GRIP domain-containing protein n=1 Tax=Angiostrongylus costaricensis TaxID=334426 RepID=A0A158PEB9_ANGCS|nr:unnamed protein product [Angiostrongylus costaricensis]